MNLTMAVVAYRQDTVDVTKENGLRLLKLCYNEKGKCYIYIML